MTVAKKLALIALGYGLAFTVGIAAVAINEFLIPYDIQQTSSGMVAFGDMIVFVLATGVVSLVPTWFLLKLGIEKAPRALLAAEFLLATMGPVSWLTVIWMAHSPAPRNLPGAVGQAIGLSMAFGAIPRIVLGPMMIVMEGATFFLVRERLTRSLLAGAMLMDVIPLSLFALHMAVAIYRYNQ